MGIRHFTTGITYDILCSLLDLPHRMLFYLPESIPDHFTTHAMYVVLRSLLTSTPFIPGPKYVYDIESWGFKPDDMYVIPWLWLSLRPPIGHVMLCAVLCPCIGLLQLHHRPLVCFPMLLMSSLVTASLAQRMLFYVPDVGNHHFIPGIMYVILCSRVGIPPLHHRHNACYSVPPM